MSQTSGVIEAGPTTLRSPVGCCPPSLSPIIILSSGLSGETIGDAFMVHFKTIDQAIRAAMAIQLDLHQNPIKTKKNKSIMLRIGICEGEMYEKLMTIQGNKVKDYFGEAVNASSRLEHEIAETNGLVFGTYTDDFENAELLKLIMEEYYVDVIEYKHKCDSNVRSSGRLLTDEHRHYCKDIDKLRGIKPINVFKCTLKK